MIKVTAVYPHREGARMDAAYYVERHVPLVRSLVGEALRGWTVSRGLASIAPGEPAPFVLVADFLFESVEAFQAAFGPHAPRILADVPNYTDITPQIFISEVLA
jgi:uncharacterized protein (TIGR02118 family)